MQQVSPNSNFWRNFWRCLWKPSFQTIDNLSCLLSLHACFICDDLSVYLLVCLCSRVCVICRPSDYDDGWYWSVVLFRCPVHHCICSLYAASSTLSTCRALRVQCEWAIASLTTYTSTHTRRGRVSHGDLSSCRVIIIIAVRAVATDCIVFVGVFFSVRTITHEPLHLARWNFARTCTSTTS